jgi:hypothetical protein
VADLGEVLEAIRPISKVFFKVSSSKIKGENESMLPPMDSKTHVFTWMAPLPLINIPGQPLTTFQSIGSFSSVIIYKKNSIFELLFLGNHTLRQSVKNYQKFSIQFQLCLLNLRDPPLF